MSNETTHTPDLRPNSFSLKIISVLVVVLVVSSFLIGSLYTKVQYLESGSTLGTTNAQVAENPQAAVPNAVGDAAAPSYGSADQVDKLRKDDHVRGERNARILLIEYSDLECPFCKRFHPTAQQIVDEYKGQVAWLYRHFPLDQIHSKARKEAEATECANELGGNEGFWKYTDKLFEVTPANNGLDPAELPKIAVQAGLDEVKFNTCLESGKYKDHVEADYQSGVKAGINGTPGNILLDTKTGKTKLIPGALPFEQFKTEIDVMLKES